MLGIGINVAVRVGDLPPELHDRAATLGLEPAAIEPTLDALLRALEHRLAQPTGAMLDDLRARDALLGRRVRWADGRRASPAGSTTPADCSWRTPAAGRSRSLRARCTCWPADVRADRLRLPGVRFTFSLLGKW